jgi:hypothetical protein
MPAGCLEKINTMYENKRQPLASRTTFYTRIAKNFLWTLIIIGSSLAIGTTGFYLTRSTSCEQPIHLLDAFHNACMLLSGMGPIISCYSNAGKWFSSFYSLFSGIVFITNVSFVLSPAIHRFYHKLHLEE